MGLRHFDRICYAVEKSGRDGQRTLICPFRRISYDGELQSLVEQRPENDDPITIELWQAAEQSDIDGFPWGKKRVIAVGDLIDTLIAESDITPWSVEGTDEMDDEGVHWDGHSARAYEGNEEITLDDIRVAAYEEIDRDASERMSDYLLVSGVGNATVALVLYPSDAEMLCGAMDTELGITASDIPASDRATAEYMRIEGLSRRVDFSPLRYAVLEAVAPHTDMLLVAATDTLEHARVVAECRRLDRGGQGCAVIQEVKVVSDGADHT